MSPGDAGMPHPQDHEPRADRRRPGGHAKHLRVAAVLGWFILMIPLAIGDMGCANVVARPAALPVRNAIVNGQLVVYSDFALAPRHRLLDDLAIERDDLLRRLDMSPSDEPVHVYLFETEKRFNTFVNQYYRDFPPRRAFFVQSDTRLAVYAFWGDRVAEDLRHEVAHGYLHSVVPTIPLWLDEGLAEFAEVARGNAGLNRPHVQLLLGAMLKGEWKPDMIRLEQLSSASEMTQIDYAESWAWVHLLLETDPDRRDLLVAYMRRLRQTGRPEPLSLELRGWEHPAHELLVEHLYALAPRP